MGFAGAGAAKVPAPWSLLQPPLTPAASHSLHTCRNQANTEGRALCRGRERIQTFIPPAGAASRPTDRRAKGTCAPHRPFAATLSLTSAVPCPRGRVRRAGALQGAQGRDLCVFALVCAREGWEEPRQFCPSVCQEPSRCKYPCPSPAGWELPPCLALAAAQGRCSPLLHYGMWVVGSG